jgi:hypothetical protein
LVKSNIVPLHCVLFTHEMHICHVSGNYFVNEMLIGQILMG